MKQIVISAGDAITAKIIEQEGFGGIWISGFEASARLGLADNGSLTMTEMLNVARPIINSVRIPVYVDVDTGYGNLTRTVAEFEAIGAAGICVEDNLPTLKQNSLWGSKIPLMDYKEFGNKIKIRRKRIKIMARTEALIRGYGFKEAKKRLLYYQECGADMLVPHARHIDQIISDLSWAKVPCVIIPTKMPECCNAGLFTMGYDMVVWANHTERVKIKAVREALQTLKKEDNALSIESNLSATLDDMRNLTPEAT